MMKTSSTRLKAVTLCAALFGIAVLTGCSTNVAVAPPTTPAPLAEKSSVSKPSSSAVSGSAVSGSADDMKSIAWQPTFEMAWATAYKQKKPIMIDFYADWCAPCKMMDSETFPHPSVTKMSAQFASVKVDTDKNTKLAQKYKIFQLPTTLWLDNRGEVIHTISGFYPPAEFVKEMKIARRKFKPIS